ncbi:hypothetical protein [Secundilactobacillus paracollinoides]|uniref:Helicase/UvrB N-terminal domain-containing protein n=1 Tax=Secundilactobacillus paracollinoides TaxID=240427 RepID=A0A1B2IWQ2_9LACO|nr:hypothetical protein [Secundilactobacillus paracollinoides]ANZ66461.1 hypothetical protein AYR63_04475 [Secundilactobacillus paracollinoides]
MNEKDFSQLYDALVETGNSGKLMTLAAPTGSGKSYAVTQFLCQQAAKDQNFHAFFVTDQKKNLRIDDFQKAWTRVDVEKRGAFEKNVVIIHSLRDTVQELLEADEKGTIPEGLDSPKLQTTLSSLRRQQKLFDLVQQQDESTMVGLSEFSKAEFAVRQAIAEKLMRIVDVNSPLDSEGKSVISHYLTTRDTPEALWMNKIYPTANILIYSQRYAKYPSNTCITRLMGILVRPAWAPTRR